MFPNPNNELLPGMFVHAQLQEGVKQKAILAPQQGVTRDLKGQATALVVNAQNKVELRVIKADRVIGDKWLVTEGPERRRQDHYRRPAVRAAGCRGEDRAGEERRVRAEGRRRSGETDSKG